MSRTYAHAPFRVFLAHADDLTIDHHGCVHDPDRPTGQEPAPCDALQPGPRRHGGHCEADSETAGAEKYGHGHHHCQGPDDWERHTWYAPERAQWRQYARAAAAEYNTHGRLEQHTDEPHTMSHPRGLWGGGWID